MARRSRRRAATHPVAFLIYGVVCGTAIAIVGPSIGGQRDRASWAIQTELGALPSDLLEYEVRASRSEYKIRHPNDGLMLTNEFYVPIDTPVRLSFLADEDHEFWIPAMRVRRELTARNLQTVWFEATALGQYPFVARMFVGDRDVVLQGSVHVVRDQEFARTTTIRGEGCIFPADVGRHYFFARQCSACHSVDGQPLVGPTLEGLWGRETELIDGTTLTVDEAYFLESVLQPARRTVKGYSPGECQPSPTFRSEALCILAYIRTLR